MFRRRGRADPDQPTADGSAAEDDQDLADPEDPGEPGYEADDGGEQDQDYDGYADDQDDAEVPGRRSGTGRHRQSREESRVNLGDPDTWTRSQQARPGQAAAGDRAAGPWDGAGSYPDRERMDFGSLLVPAVEGFDIQLNVAEEQGIWVAVVRGDSALQLQAFAAPKTSGLWEDVRRDLAEEVTKSGGDSQEADGPFGPELHARVGIGEQGQRGQLQRLRFLGADGPRWFLRGMITGPAADRGELAAPFEQIFADVVVVRGGHPAPPGDQLPIELPEEARQALAEQAALEEQGQLPPNPFERGPEITETR